MKFQLSLKWFEYWRLAFHHCESVGEVYRSNIDAAAFYYRSSITEVYCVSIISGSPKFIDPVFLFDHRILLLSNLDTSHEVCR